MPLRTAKSLSGDKTSLRIRRLPQTTSVGTEGQDGVRESTQCWREVLLGMKLRGFTRPVKLAVGDGALGFGAALSAFYPQTRMQPCWMQEDRQRAELSAEVEPAES